MYKITYFGYDIYELTKRYDMGDLIESTNVSIKKYPKFKSIGGALKYVCKILHTNYRKYDWCFEEDVCDDGDAWVLHIMVDKNNKWATEKMVRKFDVDKLYLRDLLVNVAIEKIEE